MRLLLKLLSRPLPAALRRHQSPRPTRRHALTLSPVLALVLALAVSACGPTSASHSTAKPTPTHPSGAPLPTIPPTPAIVDTSGTHTTLPAATSWNLVGSPGVGAEGRLTAVSALSASDAWAVGQFLGTDGRQHTLTEHWDGSSWTVVASPSPGPRANILSAVAARTTSDAWAVGSLIGTDSITRPLIQHWDGTAWTTSSSPDTGAQTVHAVLTGVSALSASDAWAVGTVAHRPDNQTSDQQALIEHWDGHVWSIVASPAPPPPAPPFGGTPMPELDAVAALAADDVWATGATQGATLIEHWDGAHWRVVPAPAVPQNTGVYSLSSLAAISASDIWAVGPGAFAHSLGCEAFSGVLIEHWDGHAWSSVPAALPPAQQGGILQFSLAAVAASSTRDVWASGGVFAYGSIKGVAYTPVVEHWDGSSWSLVTSPTQVTAYGLAGLATDHSGSVWAVGQHEDVNGPGATLVEGWNGSQWVGVASPSPGTLANALNGISSVSANDIWAVGSSDGGTLAEHWNGRSWSVASTPNTTTLDNTLQAVSASSARDVWAVGVASVLGGGGSANPSLVEHFDGTRWSLVPDATSAAKPAGLHGVAALSATDVWAVGGTSGGPFIEHWNGSAWSRVATPSSGIAELNFDELIAIAALSPSDIWAVGGTLPHSCGGLPPALIMHWDGSAWSIIPNTPSGLLTGIAAIAPNDVWAVGGQLVMHWNGATWSTIYGQTTANPSHAYLTAIAGAASSDVWAVGQVFAQGITIPVVEHWDGATWTAAQAPTPGLADNVLSAVTCVSAGNAWAVGYFDQSGSRDDNQALIEHYAP
jgi:hypothetical protein